MHQVTAPPKLVELANKYPECAVCKHRTVKYTWNLHKWGGALGPKPKPPKKEHMAWCDLHNRPVEHVFYQDERGMHVHGDVPCESFEYQYKPSLFLLKCYNDAPDVTQT